MKEDGIMIKNEFEEQKNNLMRDYNYHRVTGKVRDKFTFHKLLLAIAILAIINAPHLSSSPLKGSVKSETKTWPFPNTWTCSQCGYDNYEGIAWCGRCGGR